MSETAKKRKINDFLSRYPLVLIQLLKVQVQMQLMMLS